MLYFYKIVSKHTLKVYPNPSSGDFNIDFGTINTAKSFVRVYDMQGKSVYSFDITTNISIITLDNVANGMYLLEITTEKGKILKKIVKQ